MLSSTRAGIRSLRAVMFAIGILVAVPAVSQAAATTSPGISAAGTVPGTYNGNPVSVQVAAVQACSSGTSTFVVMWPGGVFKEAAAGQSDSCSNFNGSGMPQSLTFSGSGTPSGTLSGGDMEGPGSTTNPNTVGFTITTASGGTLVVPQGHLGPLQGAPGRVQPYASGAAGLEFVTQPSNSSVNNPITPSVTVETVDSSGNPLSTNGVAITISLASNPGDADISGTLTEDTVNGVASFPDVVLDRPFVGYELGASSPGLTGATSNPFNESQTTSTICAPGAECDTFLRTEQDTLSVSANPGGDPAQDAGTLTESVDLLGPGGQPLSCADEQYGGYFTSDPTWYGFDITGSANKQLTNDLVGVSPDGLEICFGANVTFPTNSGDDAAPGTLPDGTRGFIGLLPDCPEDTVATTPCIVSEREFENDFGSGTEVTIDIPQAFAGDPFAHA